MRAAERDAKVAAAVAREAEAQKDPALRAGARFAGKLSQTLEGARRRIRCAKCGKAGVPLHVMPEAILAILKERPTRTLYLCDDDLLEGLKAVRAYLLQAEQRKPSGLVAAQRVSLAGVPRVQLARGHGPSLKP